MKKIISSFLFVGMFFLAGCNSLEKKKDFTQEQKNKEYYKYENVEIEDVLEKCKIAHQQAARAGVNLAFDEDMCYLEFAEERNDPMVCEEYIKKQSIKDQCFGWIGKELKDELLCDQIEDSEWSYHCYYLVGSYKKDLAICDKAGKQKDSCYNVVALESRDPFICKKTQNKENCYRKYFDNLLCEKFGDVKYKEYDLIKCLERTKNVDSIDLLGICESIGDEEIKASCFFSVFVVKKDNSVCDKIRDEYYKRKCNL